MLMNANIISDWVTNNIQKLCKYPDTIQGYPQESKSRQVADENDAAIRQPLGI